MNSVLKNPFFRFIFFGSVIYLGWYFSYEYYLKPETRFDDYIIDSLVRIAQVELRFLGYTLTDYSSVDSALLGHVGIEGSKGVTIGAPCDGFVLLALFMAFIVAFPGPWKHRIWFLPLGMLSIHLFNSFRVAALAIIVHVNEDWLSFNHDYTFTLIVYAFVFFLWWIWVKKFSGTNQIKAES